MFLLIYMVMATSQIYIRCVQAASSTDLQSLVDRMWRYDQNRLSRYFDYNYDLQARAYYTETVGTDYSYRPLFSNVNSAVLQKPTYKAFAALIDNYEAVVGRKERETYSEKREINRFLDVVMKSKVMQEVYKFLKAERKASTQYYTFRKELYNVWFGLYRRSRFYDSCGFEHVFLGELKDKVLGLHSWLQFYLLEKKGEVNYVGYMSQRRDTTMLSLQFTWNGKIKPKGSIFLGTSPEFEFALYTLVYKLNQGPVDLQIGGQQVTIKCYSLANKIGTCYPSTR